jgi:hypothetical protein
LWELWVEKQAIDYHNGQKLSRLYLVTPQPVETKMQRSFFGPVESPVGPLALAG